MKKSYSTPIVEKIEFKYSQQVVASGDTVTDACWWKNNSSWSHGTPTCQD